MKRLFYLILMAILVMPACVKRENCPNPPTNVEKQGCLGTVGFGIDPIMNNRSFTLGFTQATNDGRGKIQIRFRHQTQGDVFAFATEMWEKKMTLPLSLPYNAPSGGYTIYFQYEGKQDSLHMKVL
jgi:hypothetical protein